MLFSFFLNLFGAPTIPFDALGTIEAQAPNIIVWAAPVMFFFVLLEWFISYKQSKHLYDKKESVGSILVGIGNVFVNLAIKLTMFTFVIWVYNALPYRMALNWWTFIPCYLIFDLCSYWSHRISHQQRFWWATHVVHHSAEHYNLTVSFRLSWVQHLKLIFFLPVALLGFHPIVFFVVNQIAVLFQFWVHTEYIPKLHPWVEYMIATPSNHRVHHGSQEKYINKNYGATFIFWDRLFGTYQKEEEQVHYGITTNIKDKANPITINFHEYVDMWNDLKQAKGLKKKLFFIFGDPIAIANEKKLQETWPQGIVVENTVELPAAKKVTA
ncbi:sterol desaturase family protein [Aridibaculum aurantiacum]|uniref:sterol desaturase family protein n=1 Tax=Aridibaculum aurantiacum TaxID=2810307 RepID=UPI001A95FE7A|nr:sterol desaturase family protein [Aridibaculum aurantiacum]